MRQRDARIQFTALLTAIAMDGITLMGEVPGLGVDCHDPAHSGTVIDILTDIDFGNQFVILDGGRKALLHLGNQ